MLAKRELSRQLISLWITDHDEARDLLTRIFPAGLTTFLYSDDDLPEDAFKQQVLDNRDNLGEATKAGAVPGGVVGETVNEILKSEQVQNVKNVTSRVAMQVGREGGKYLRHWRDQLGIDRKIPILDSKPTQTTPQNAQSNKDAPVILRKGRKRVKPEDNWKLFFYQIYKDHKTPSLIWNFKTREELKLALEEEVRVFNQEELPFKL